MASPKEYWVWLSLAYGSANHQTDELLRKFGEPQALYQAVKQWDTACLSRAMLERLANIRLEKALSILDWAQQHAIQILTPEDAEFPQRLRQINGVPCVLYVEGSLGDVDEALTLAMVGTRRCSDYGHRAAARLASGLAEAGAVIVSGLAAGIDSVCHEAAVQCAQRTIAVMGCGIDYTYPSQNKALRERITQHGAVITEFAPGVGPLARNFPTRNRLISGLSMGTIVVEASRHSGSLITANLALDQGRDVFAVPGSIFSDSSQGTLHLLRQGAIPVGGAQDVLEEYRYRFAGKVDWSVLERTAPAARKENGPEMEQLMLARQQGGAEAPPDLSPQALLVWHMLGEEPIQLDEIAHRLQKSAREVLTAMTELEIIGKARALSGKRYQRME